MDDGKPTQPRYHSPPFLPNYIPQRFVPVECKADALRNHQKVISLMCMGDSIAQVAYGAGRHEAYLSADVIEVGLKLNYIGQVLFLWAPCFVKVSIALFLLRVTPDLVLRKIVQTAMFFILAWNFSCFMTLLLQCKNLAVIWRPSTVTTCWSTQTIHSLGWASAGKSHNPDEVAVLLSNVTFARQLYPLAATCSSP